MIDGGTSHMFPVDHRAPMSSALTPEETARWEAHQAPQLVEGLSQLGEYDRSGVIGANYLLRRHDGRMLLISPLLYSLVDEIDGHRNLATISANLSSRMGKSINCDGVAYLLQEKLRPLGILADFPDGNGSSKRPLTAVAARRALVPPGFVRAAAKAMKPLFSTPVVAAVLGGVVAMDAWLVSRQGVGLGMSTLTNEPELLLLVCGLTVLAGAFHELGHAAATSYGGAEPGAIGMGIYLMWPVFYTDLTDSYRLPRAGRLRADLGGIYFNLILVLVLGGFYAITGSPVLLLALVVQQLSIAQQFIPFLRLDGYYVVSDLVGVPDLFAEIKPAFRAWFRRRSERKRELRPGVKAVVGIWVLTSTAILSAAVLLLIVRLPHLAELTSEEFQVQFVFLKEGMRTGEVSTGLVAFLRLVTLTVQVTGLSVLAAGAVNRAVRALQPVCFQR